MLTRRGKLDQAGYYLQEAGNREKCQNIAGRDDEQAERINHVFSLVPCLERQEKLTEAT